jgi:hypothetical protein
MSQEPFDFGRIYRLEAEHKLLWRATENAIDSVGLIVAAGASGMDAPDLNKTFVPNSGRHLRARTIMGIGAVAGLDARRAILTPIARLFGFDIEVAQPMDDREARIRLEEGLKALGPVGEAKLREIYGDRQ